MRLMYSWPGALALAVPLAACGGSPASGNADFGSASRDSGAIALRQEMAFVVPPNRLIPADELAAAVRKTGYPCGAVTAFGQLELNGRALDNYKLDCGERSYLVTWLEAKARIKPWGGGILEPSRTSRQSRHSPRISGLSTPQRSSVMPTN
jgi:hypothetical protein